MLVEPKGILNTGNVKTLFFVSNEAVLTLLCCTEIFSVAINFARTDFVSKLIVCVSILANLSGRNLKVNPLFCVDFTSLFEV